MVELLSNVAGEKVVTIAGEVSPRPFGRTNAFKVSGAGCIGLPDLPKTEIEIFAVVRECSLTNHLCEAFVLVSRHNIPHQMDNASSVMGHGEDFSQGF